MNHHRRPRVGLFIAGGTYSYQAEIIYGAHEESQRHGLDMICFAGGSLGWADPRNYVYHIAAARNLEATILVPGTWGASMSEPKVRELLERYQALPCCLIGARWGDTPSVCIDNEGGVAEMTKHLIEVHGRRRIAFIAGRGAEAEQRYEGYSRALRDAGITPDPELYHAGDYTLEAGRRAAVGFCEGARSFDAIIAANDWMATGALEVLLERGVSVPEQVSLIGFDDIDRASFMSPPLTTIRQPPRFLGTEAAAMVAALLAGNAVDRHVLVPTQPQVRRSCGCFGHASALRSFVLPRVAGTPMLADARGRIADVLTDNAGALVKGLPSDWALSLVDAVAQDIANGTEHVFLEDLARWITATAVSGNITGWHHVVSRLREQVIPCLAQDVNVSTRAEALFARAYIAIGERSERAQGQRILEREDTIARLEDLSREARTALDWPSLCSTLDSHLPRFRIPGFYVATGQGGAGTASHLAYAFDAGEQRPLPPGGVAFETGDVIAPELWPEHRTSLVVHPLFMRDEILGHCCLELGPKDGSIIKTFGEVIGSSLKATRLAEALVGEVTRRERAERERLLQELDIAARIQSAILPKAPTVPGLELATAMRPATEVGGDYFDILPCGGGAWIGIGDVAGHGLQAGLVMLMIQSIMAATVHDRPNLSAREAWRAVNTILTDNIRQRLEQDEHATLCLLRYHDSGRLCFAGAHEDLIVYRAATGRSERIGTGGIWAGISREPPEDEDNGERECNLDVGDVLLLYTDGILEAKSKDGALYGAERLQRTLEAVGTLPVTAICEHILGDVTRWMAAQDDDITLVVARRVGRAT